MNPLKIQNSSKQFGVWGMKSNKKNNLLTNLFKSYIIQCVIWTGIIVVVAIILGAVLQKVLDKYVPNYYLVYRSLYLGIAAIVILAICIIRLTYKLLKNVVAYVDELQHAIGQIFDKDVNYVKLSPELADIAIKLNHLKQESENNARLAKENEQYFSRFYFHEEYYSFVSKIIVAHRGILFNKSYFFHETFYLSTFLSFVCTIDLNIFSIHA